MRTTILITKAKGILRPKFWWWMCFAFITYIALPKNALAQNCASTVPAYTIDFTGNADSTWTSPSVSRNGICCSKSSTDCIIFYITLDPNAVGVSIDAVGGLGNTDYEINCANATPLGSSTCIYNTGSFYVTICKPGNNAQQYTVTSIPKPYAPKKEFYISPGGCTATLQIKGYNTSSITWTSLSGSSYNSNLSCTSGCATTVVSRTTSFPSYVDYRVCGTPASSCLSGTYCDTIRVYNNSALDVAITPGTAYLCAGSSTVRVTASASGGKTPYAYSWNNGSTDSSVLVGAGTFIVTATDALGCQIAKDTVVVSAQPNPAPAVTGSTNVCPDVLYTYSVTAVSGHTYAWSINNGTIIGASNTNSIEVNWTSAGPGSVSVVQTNGSTGCQGSATKNVTVNSKPPQKNIQH